MGSSEASGSAVAAWLAAATGAAAAAVTRMERLGGGAIQENWGLDVVCRGGRLDGTHALVLRTDAPSRVAVSWDRAQEFRILEVAFRAGVTAPEPIALCLDPSVLGRPFYLMRRVAGEARGFKLVRDPLVRERGEALAARLGAELAKLHRVAPPVPGLGFIPVPAGSAALARIAEYRAHLDEMGSAECVLEWALAWLERHAPPAVPPRLLHADFRTGNYLVDRGELTAVLDWEFAGFGDPLEDLGWMLGRYWRFGAYEREAGGIGSREALLARLRGRGRARDRSSGRALLGGDGHRALGGDRADAGRQALRRQRAVAGAGAHRPCPAGPGAGPAHPRARDRGDRAMSHLHATGDLLAVARAALRERVMPRLDEEGRYEAAMVANAMAIAIRELELGPGVQAEERTLLGEFYGTEAPLAELRRRLCLDLRAGRFAAARAGELRDLLARLVHARLAISNPDYGSARPSS